MKKHGMILIACIMLSGCSVIEFSNKAPEYSGKVVSAIDASEPVVSALEDATGYTIAPEMAESSSYWAKKVEAGSSAAQKVAAVAAAVPGPQQPIAGALIGIFGAVAGIAGAVGRFMANRKAKVAKEAVKTMVKATIPLDGSGEAVKDALPSAAVGDLIEETYKAVKNG